MTDDRLALDLDAFYQEVSAMSLRLCLARARSLRSVKKAEITKALRERERIRWAGWFN